MSIIFLNVYIFFPLSYKLQTTLKFRRKNRYHCLHSIYKNNADLEKIIGVAKVSC